MARTMIPVLIIAALLCSFPASTQTVFSIPAEIEALLGLQVDARGITFQVHSNGCTRKAAFEVQIFDSRPLQLLLVRNTPDSCEALVPYGKRIRFSYQELGLPDGQRVVVLNSLSTIRVARGR